MEKVLKVCACGGILAGIYILHKQGRWEIRRQLRDCLQQTVTPINALSRKDERRLVFTTGHLVASSKCGDPHFSQPKFFNMCKLYRKVEMYQWQEHKDKYGKCSYKKTWSSCHIGNNIFQNSGSESPYKNPRMLVSTEEFSADELSVSGFWLDDKLREKIKFWEEIQMSHVYFGAQEWMRRSDGWFYASKSSHYVVGDLRARFWAVKPNIRLSVLAGQCGERLIPFIFDPRIYEVVAESGSVLARQFVSPAIAELIVVYASGIEAHIGKIKMSLSFVSKDHHTAAAVFQQLHLTDRIRRKLELVVAWSLIWFAACQLGFDLIRCKSKKFNETTNI